MANISLYGASYTDVPACTLPQTGGGEVLFTDTSPTTAAAADVAAGKYFFTANGVLTLGTSSGGIEDGHVYQDQDGYIVLDDETGKVYQTVSKSYTPSETAQSETITPSSGYDALSSVSVSVGAISSSYVGSGITRRSSSDLTASGATVTVPSGYYSTQATKAVSSGSATTPATTITANPSISVGSDGLITATASATKSVTPTVSAGYVSSGTAGTITVSGSNTSQLSTQAAATITPSTSAQTAVAAGKYTTGAVTVAAMPTGSVSASATKGTVSNHSVSVTPTATVGTAGYIAAGSTNGTAVTVSASELVSGNKAITANGTNIDVADYSTVSVAVSGGGGGDMSDPIRFFDYDGALVASYTSVPSSLPTVPTHAGLTSGAWNYTLQQITTQFNAMGACDVGANYATTSGATEIDIVLQAGRLHPYLSLSANGTVSIDWGDGSTPDTATGTSTSTRIADIHHEYDAAGSYTIKISKTSGAAYALYTTSTYTLLNKNASKMEANRTYSNCVRSVRVGDYCTISNNAFQYCYSLESVAIPSNATFIGSNAFSYCYSLRSLAIPSGIANVYNYTFYYCYSLQSVSMPSSVTNIGTYAFQYCYSIASLTIPSGVTSIGNYAFSYCYSLEALAIPSGVTSIGTYAFYFCNALTSVTMPSGITSIGTYAFAACYSLESLTIPSGVTSIGNNAFQYCYSIASLTIPSGLSTIPTKAFHGCYGMSEYHFEETTVPTLASTDAFGYIQDDCIIYVPSASLSDYQTANIWSDYASYMVGE